MRKLLAPFLTLVLLVAAGAVWWFLLSPKRERHAAVAEVQWEDVEVIDLRVAVERACAKGDADALWSLMSDRFREEIDREATRCRGFDDPALLKETYQYEGSPDGFDGRALLAGSFGRGPAHDPCFDASRWTLVDKSGTGEHRTFVYRRTDGYNIGIQLERLASRWVLDQITKPVRPEE